MDLDWASPWQEDAAETPTGSSQAPVSRLSTDIPWRKVEDIGDWPNPQSDWPLSSGQHTRISETSGWGISDDQPPSSLPVPPRQHSPDPWAGVSSLNDERAEIHSDALGIKSNVESQERENANHQQTSVQEIEQGSNFERDNGGSAPEANSPDNLLHQQLKLKVAGDEIPSPQQIHTDATSSRPSSLFSDHADNLTGSSRTSFEQEPVQDPSKVKKLVSHFDRLAKEIEDTPVVTRKGSASENEANDEAPRDDSSIGSDAEGDEFGDFEEETPDPTSQISQVDKVKNNIASVRHNVTFKVDLLLVEKLLSDIFPLTKTPQGPTPTATQSMHEDVFTTIEERKTWHRISRYGTMRKHDTGNDENYRRVKWESSKIREETVRIVSRWRTEDSASGSVTLGGGNRGSMFGWDDKTKRNSGPIDLFAIWAERTSKHRSMPLPTSLKTPSKSTLEESMGNPKSPMHPPARFGWSTEDNGANDKLNTPPSPAPSSSFSLEPPPPPSPSTSPTPSSQPLTVQSSIRPNSLDYSHHPRIASIKGLGHRSTMSLDRKSPRLTSAPIVPPVKSAPPMPKPEIPSPGKLSIDEDDENDWGDMVSSTPDIDATFAVLDKTVQGPTGSRNRADSAPGLRALKQVPSSTRAISLQPGAISALSLINTTCSDDPSPALNNFGLLKADQKYSVQVDSISELSNTMSEPPTDPTPTIPKLSAITDDFDGWGTTPAEPTTEPHTNTPTSIFTQPTSGQKPPTTTTDDFNAWAVMEDFPTSASETNMPFISKAVASRSTLLPTPLKKTPVSTSLSNEMNGWSDANFSIFESTMPVDVSPRKSSTEEPPKHHAKSSETRQKETPNTEVLSIPERNEFNDKSEEDRLVQSIVAKLPNLGYMFLP